MKGARGKEHATFVHFEVPVTDSWAECWVTPARFLATQVYNPICRAVTCGIEMMEPAPPSGIRVMFILRCISLSFSIHCTPTGLSPSTEHVTVADWPSDRGLSPNVKGTISGGARFTFKEMKLFQNYSPNDALNSTWNGIKWCEIWRFHINEHQNYSLVKCNTMYTVYTAAAFFKSEAINLRQSQQVPLHCWYPPTNKVSYIKGL